MQNREPASVLMVEDDRQIADFVCKGLVEAGFVVDWAASGVEGYERAVKGKYHVIILDIMLPGMDGLELLRRLRDLDITTPVLILSAKSRVSDRVRGLQAGGDDYLIKPFAFSELLARLQSLLRRARGSHEPVTLRVSDLTLDVRNRRVFRDQEEIELKPQEFILFEYLVRHRGQVVTRTQILRDVWGYQFNPSTNVVEVHVCKLREKIERPDRPKLLRTIRGAGYLMVDDDQIPS
jgi:two-component system, OmpR family, response regulator